MHASNKKPANFLAGLFKTNGFYLVHVFLHGFLQSLGSLQSFGSLHFVVHSVFAFVFAAGFLLSPANAFPINMRASVPMTIFFIFK